MWKGNVAEMVKDAIAKGNLSEWLVSIAPSASHKLWLEACQAYSEQLAKSGKYDRAAAYLLACHKVDEAVELLRGQSLYREALAIARCRLDEEDPTIRKLLMEWGQDLIRKGNYEVAAILTSIKEYLDAAKTLRNRANLPECISLAAKLALKAGEEGKELALIITLQCLRSYLSECNWNAAMDCIKPIEELKPFSIIIELHRKLVEGYRSIHGKNEDLLSHWLSADGEATIGSEATLLQLSSLPFHSITPTDAYIFIATRRSTSEKNLMIGLAEELALAVCAASSGDRVKEWYHILKSMNVCYAQQLLVPKEDIQFSLLHLCFLLSPRDALDPSAACYYKEEVKIHKIEQELAKLKASLKLNSIQVKDSNKKCNKSQDESPGEKSNVNGEITGNECVPESAREGEDGTESEGNRSDEDI
ncbi:hypothetical protein J437_LFUL007497, partial [Ladona fulva]